MFRRALILACTLSVFAAPLRCADSADGERSEDAYLDDQGRLVHALTIRDAQGGFAGFSGTLWTIDVGGSWSRAPFLNDDVRKPEGEGELSGEQLRALAAAFKKHALVDLPAKLGGEPMTNPRVITLTFGKLSSELVLGAGAELPADDDKAIAEEVQRFAAIVNVVQKMLAKANDE